MSVSVRNDLEARDAGDDVFSRDAGFSNVAGGLVVLLAQGVLLATFLAQGGLAVERLQAPIPRVGAGFGLGMQPNPGLVQQPAVVAAAPVVGEAENPARGPVDDEVRLQGVAVFLARVVPALLF